jgi:serine/threonine protein kinase
VFLGLCVYECPCAAGLLHAQNKHVCHLDLTLENLRVARDGRIVIANFDNCKRFKKRTMIVPYEDVSGNRSL